jgi:hypothetical protein
MEPSLPPWATQLIWNALIWTALVSFLSSIILRFLPQPGAAEDQIHSRIYLIVYNVLRRIALNAPYQANRNGNGGAPGRLVPLVLCVLCASAVNSPAQVQTQIQVSFQPNPAAVVNKITGGGPSMKNLLLYDVSIYNASPEARAVTPGAVLMAAQHSGIATVGPAQTRFLFQRVEALHWKALILNGLGWGTSIAGVAIGYKGQMAPWLIAALPVAGTAFQEFERKLSGKMPDFGGISDVLLKDDFALMPGASRSLVMFATAGPDKTVFGEISALPISTTKP